MLGFATIEPCYRCAGLRGSSRVTHSECDHAHSGRFLPSKASQKFSDAQQLAGELPQTDGVKLLLRSQVRSSRRSQGTRGKFSKIPQLLGPNLSLPEDVTSIIHCKQLHNVVIMISVMEIMLMVMTMITVHF